MGVGVRGAKRRVKGPTGVHAAGDHGGQRRDGSRHIEVPAQQVHSGKRHIFGADHQGHHEVANHRRHRRNQEEENHDDSVHGEQLVVGVGRDQVTRGRQQLQADHHGEESAQPEHRGDRDQVQDRDPLMIGGQQPRLDAVVGIQVILALDSLYSGCHVTPLGPMPHCSFDVFGADEPSPASPFGCVCASDLT